jgi:hypothetical protein
LGDTIWGVHATECTQGGGDPESCIRAVPIKIDPPAASGAPRATLIYEPGVIGEPDLFYTFPGVAVNKDGQTALVYQVSGADQPLSTWWTMKDPAETSFRPPNRLSVGSCSRTESRFGDYTGAHTDADNQGFWFAGERATRIAGTCQWETQIGGFTP